MCHYPQEWWEKIDPSSRYSWEVLPQDAGPGEVVLSKRTELGVFSNLSKSPFNFNGVKYNSIEGLWQMMKYPDVLDEDDPRNSLNFPYSRNEVAKFYGKRSKLAGKIANKIMIENGIQWVSYNRERFNYRDFSQGSEKHYNIIFAAIKEKIFQNKKLKKLLIKTKGLKLIPDHYQGNVPESYKYHLMLMKVRDSLILNKSL